MSDNPKNYDEDILNALKKEFITNIDADIMTLTRKVGNLEKRVQSLESHHMVYGPLDYDVFTMPSDEAKKRAVPRSVVEAMAKHHGVIE